MRREEVVGGGMGAIKATSANGWTRREKVEGADAWARSEQAEGRDIGPGKVSRNIRVSTGGFFDGGAYGAEGQYHRAGV